MLIVLLLYFQKPVPSYSFTFFLTCSIFGTISLPLSIRHFFPFPQSRFHRPYSQSKTFLNIRAHPTSAIFCSNAVLITMPSYSMNFFNLFDVLPSTPTTTEMTLIFLMLHIVFISLFSSWYLSIFPSLFR